MPLLQCLYGKHAAALYAQAADFNKTSRFYYMKAEDAYYLANAQASFDDWRRSRKQVLVPFKSYSSPFCIFCCALGHYHAVFCTVVTSKAFSATSCYASCLNIS